MAIKITSLEDAISDNGLKALVHAPAGTGKTVFTATANAPTLIISAESGLLSLAQDKEKLRGNGSPDFAPEYCEVVEVKNLFELTEVWEHLAAGTKYDWIALDSITEIAETVLAAELKENKDPRAAYGNLQSRMLTILKNFRDLPKYNVIMTCKQEIKVDETSNVTMYKPMMPGTKLAQQIPYLFDEVWCLRVSKDDEGDNFHYVQAVRELQYEAKDRSGALSDCEPPSLLRLYNKIRGASGKGAIVDEQNNEGDLVDNSTPMRDREPTEEEIAAKYSDPDEAVKGKPSAFERMANNITE